MLGLWTGLVPALILVANPAVQFVVYEQLKIACLKATKQKNVRNDAMLGLLVAFALTHLLISLVNRVAIGLSDFHPRCRGQDGGHGRHVSVDRAQVANASGTRSRRRGARGILPRHARRHRSNVPQRWHRRLLQRPALQDCAERADGRHSVRDEGEAAVLHAQAPSGSCCTPSERRQIVCAAPRYPHCHTIAPV